MDCKRGSCRVVGQILLLFVGMVYFGKESNLMYLSKNPKLCVQL